MIILDANILLYAFNADSPVHKEMRDWLEQTMQGTESVGFPWISLLAFVRISTNPKVRAAPISLPQAFQTVRALIGQPNAFIPQPGATHAELLERLAVASRAGSHLITDASLAALAMEQGATLASTHTDFARFPGLKWINPLNLK